MSLARMIAMVSAGVVLLAGSAVASSAEERRPDPPPAQADDILFSTSLRMKAAALASCRIDVSRTRMVPPVKLLDERAHLRLWIARDGRVNNSVVSATGAMGPEFVDCVKKQVDQWWLLPPEGGKGGLVDVKVKVQPIGPPEVQIGDAGQP